MDVSTIGVIASLNFLVASIWAVVGTNRQAQLAIMKLRREEAEAMSTHTTVSQWISEVPRWRVLRRPALRREIESIFRDDDQLWWALSHA